MPITTCTHKDGNHEHCLSFEENGYTFNKLCNFKSCNLITVLPHRSHINAWYHLVAGVPHYNKMKHSIVFCTPSAATRIHQFINSTWTFYKY